MSAKAHAGRIPDREMPAISDYLRKARTRGLRPDVLSSDDLLQALLVVALEPDNGRLGI